MATTAPSRRRARRRPPREAPRTPPRSCARSWRLSWRRSPKGTRPRSTATCCTSRARARSPSRAPRRSSKTVPEKKTKTKKTSTSRPRPRNTGFAALAETCADARADWVPNRASANATDALIAALASRVAERARRRNRMTCSPRDERVARRRRRRERRSLAARLASAFSFGGAVGASSSSADGDDDAPATPLADACARLLLVLVTFPARTNPFRDAARACADETETGRTSNASKRETSSASNASNTSSRNSNAREFLSKAVRGAPNRVPVVVDHRALLETLSAFAASDAPLLHFLVTECDALAARSRSRRGFGDAGEADVTALAPALISALDGFGAAQASGDRAMSGTTAPGRGDAASPSRGLETAGKGSDSTRSPTRTRTPRFPWFCSSPPTRASSRRRGGETRTASPTKPETRSDQPPPSRRPRKKRAS